MLAFLDCLWCLIKFCPGDALGLKAIEVIVLNKHYSITREVELVVRIIALSTSFGCPSHRVVDARGAYAAVIFGIGNGIPKMH